jgi:hypothetical protein
LPELDAVAVAEAEGIDAIGFFINSEKKWKAPHILRQALRLLFNSGIKPEMLPGGILKNGGVTLGFSGGLIGFHPGRPSRTHSPFGHP